MGEEMQYWTHLVAGFLGIAVGFSTTCVVGEISDWVAARKKRRLAQRAERDDEEARAAS